MDRRRQRRTLPKFVTEELHKYLDCGILARGFAHLYCDDCGEHHVVAFSCKARAVPQLPRQRMNEGALNLVDHVLPTSPSVSGCSPCPSAAFTAGIRRETAGASGAYIHGHSRGVVSAAHIERGLPTASLAP